MDVPAWVVVAARAYATMPVQGNSGAVHVKAADVISLTVMLKVSMYKDIVSVPAAVVFNKSTPTRINDHGLYW